MIAGIVLAAGTSSRLGRPKQLLLLKERPLTQHVIDAAIAAGLRDVIVILGHQAEDVRAGLDLRPPARAVVNPDYEQGQSSSLRAGLRAAGPEIRAVLILLGDQPGISSAAIRAVVTAYERTGAPMVRAAYGDEPGHPVLFDRSVWPELEALEGDRGARDLLSAHPDRVVNVALEGRRPLDVDSWDDFERLTEADDRDSSGRGG